MQFKDSLILVIKLGWRNVFRQKRRSYIVISAALFGSLGMLFMMANINAFFESMITMTIDAGLGHVQIRPKNFEKTRKIGMMIEDDSLDHELSQLGLKIKYTPRLEREGLMRSGSGSVGVLIIGVDPLRERSISLYENGHKQDHFLQIMAPKKKVIVLLNKIEMFHV